LTRKAKRYIILYRQSAAKFLQTLEVGMAHDIFRAAGAILFFLGGLLAVKKFNILMALRHETGFGDALSVVQPYPYWNLMIIVIMMIGFVIILKPKQNGR
jgi:hypothetical protein